MIKSAQQGFTFVIVMLILLLAVSSYLYSTLDFRNVTEERRAKTQAALVDAKKSVLARMITTIEGELPANIGATVCPDDDLTDNKKLVGSCAGDPQIGRLPNTSLSIVDTPDGYGEDLWLVTSDLMNTTEDPYVNLANLADPSKMLNLDGQAVVALIIAPNDPVNDVQRNNRPSDDIEHYFEAENADGDDIFTRGNGISEFNDEIIAITANDVLNTIKPEMILDAFAAYIEAIADQNSGDYPYAEKDDDGNCTSTSATLGHVIGKVPLNFLSGCPFSFIPANSDESLYKQNILVDRWWPNIWYAVSPACESGGSCDPNGFEPDSSEIAKNDDDDEGGVDTSGNYYVSMNGENYKYILFYSGTAYNSSNMPLVPGACNSFTEQNFEVTLNSNDDAVCDFLEYDFDSDLKANSNRVFGNSLGNDIAKGYK